MVKDALLLFAGVTAVTAYYVILFCAFWATIFGVIAAFAYSPWLGIPAACVGAGACAVVLSIAANGP
jgi:hypothetical protein